MEAQRCGALGTSGSPGCKVSFGGQTRGRERTKGENERGNQVLKSTVWGTQELGVAKDLHEAVSPCPALRASVCPPTRLAP